MQSESPSARFVAAADIKVVIEFTVFVTSNKLVLTVELVSVEVTGIETF